MENITDRRGSAPLPDTERLYLEVLTRKYILVYYLELEADRAEVLKLDEHANV